MRKVRTKSMTKVILVLFSTFIISLIISIIVYTLGIARQINLQIAQNTSSMLNMIKINLEDTFERAEDYISDLSLLDKNFQNLGSKQDMTRTYDMSRKISDYTRPIFDSNTYLSSIFVYSSTTGIYHDVYGRLAGENGEERLKLKSGIRNDLYELLQSKSFELDHWFVLDIEARNFLCHITRWQSVYMVCLIDLGQMANNIEVQYNIDGHIVFSQDGELLIPVSDERLERLTWNGISGDYKIIYGRRPLLTVEESIGDIGFACVTSYDNYVQHISIMQILLLVLLAVLLLFMIIAYYYLKKHLVKPINEMVKIMKSIELGNMEARVREDYKAQELRILGTSFNSMLESIQKLNIEVFEKQLENEKIQLTALKLQIRPHFYLNCLKSIYALAAMGERDKVMDKVLHLSNHLRYVFTEFGDFVPLEQELSLCRNYVGLLNVDVNERIHYHENIESQLNNFRIPPVSLLTLVENSFKHANIDYNKEKLDIGIEAQILANEEGKLINIVVKDNGIGFPDHWLSRMNNLSDDHVGINNFIKRMNLFYKDKCSIAFSNNRGAQVDIFILLTEEE